MVGSANLKTCRMVCHVEISGIRMRARDTLESEVVRREMELVRKEKKLLERKLAVARREIELLRERQRSGVVERKTEMDMRQAETRRVTDPTGTEATARASIMAIAELLGHFDRTSDSYEMGEAGAAPHDGIQAAK